MPLRDRLDVLDGLRGIAILLVVWYHAWLVSGQGLGALNFIGESGFLGVELFFFISGFCICYPYVRAWSEGRAGPTLRHFASRRALKILPSYLLVLIIFSIVYRSRFVSPGDAAWQLLSHLTFVHTFSPATFGSISGPLWTIGIEVQFYLLFPLLVPWFRRSPVLAYGGLIAAAEAYRAALAAFGLSNDFGWINQLPAFLDLFGAGMFAAWALIVLRERAAGSECWAKRATVVSLALFACAVAGLAVATQVTRSASADAAHEWLNLHRIAIGPLCVGLALSTSLALPRWRAVVASRALVFLSVISYNLYLWHLEIAIWYQGAGLPPAVAFVLSIGSALAVATLVTYAFERPILHGDVGKGRPPRRIPAAVAVRAP